MKKVIVVGALFAMLSVVFGAFAAHGLKNWISESALATFQIGVEYQFYHAIALILTACLGSYMEKKWVLGAAGCFVVGTLFFCGSLYLLAITGVKWFGPITPIGGMFFISGWIALAVGALKSKNSE